MMEIDVTTLRSRSADEAARGVMAVALIGLITAWLQMPMPQPLLPRATAASEDVEARTIIASVRRAVAYRTPGAWFRAIDIALALDLAKSQVHPSLRRLVASGELEASGVKNSRRYRRPPASGAVCQPEAAPARRATPRIASAPAMARPNAPTLQPPKSPEAIAIDEAVAAGRITKCPPAYVGVVAGGDHLDLGGHVPTEKLNAWNGRK